MEICGEQFRRVKRPCKVCHVVKQACPGSYVTFKVEGDWIFGFIALAMPGFGVLGVWEGFTVVWSILGSVREPRRKRVYNRHFRVLELSKTGVAAVYPKYVT